ncbi:MAG: alpha/beta fold hydrolase [Propionibacteriales bacterium]|nr:alpha/beta fold hydrolase [Propionibacteriales bacterium]
MFFARLKLAAVLVVLAGLGAFSAGFGVRADAASSPTAPVSPYGANDWSCEPDAAHPYPVILVHGTYGDQQSVNDYLSWYLSATGYCVFALDYGFYGTNAIKDSAAELKVFVDRVLAATGAAKVSFVGHSQGGTMPRYYIKYLGGSARVDDLIAFAPGNHGTTWRALLTLVPGFTCRACQDLMVDSDFLDDLNAGDESPGSVSYTNIVTQVDTVVTPYTSGYLAPAPNVANIRIQDYCPSNATQHYYLPLDPAFIRFAADALAHPGPASTSYRPKCSW